KVSPFSMYGDISSPIAKQVAAIGNIPLSQTTDKIIQALNSTASLSQIQNPVQTFALNGFINFKLNRSFINAKIISVGSDFSIHSTNDSQIDLCNKFPELQKAKKQLLSSVEIVTETQKSNMKLLICNEEIALMKEIALAEPEEIQTENSQIFFQQRLCRAFNDFYLLCPLYTSNMELTKARFLLVKAFLGRLSVI
ncbi:MAG: hypothetical protein Q4F84_08350, partial [Fibrobacter sp.]|nr:hypothetical protein [Fibrobacter sp.]